jgi:hypothetical protein
MTASDGAALVRQLVHVAAHAISDEEVSVLSGEVPTGGHGYYGPGIVATAAMLRVLADAAPGTSQHAVEFDFASLADLLDRYGYDPTATVPRTDNRVWRVGSRYGVHIYSVNPVGVDDEPIGTAHRPWVAAQIVAEHNCRLVDTSPREPE